MSQNERQVKEKDTWVGKAIGEWSEALLVIENKPKPRDPGFAPSPPHPPRPGQSLKKDAWVRRLLLSSEVSA